ARRGRSLGVVSRRRAPIRSAPHDRRVGCGTPAARRPARRSPQGGGDRRVKPLAGFQHEFLEAICSDAPLDDRLSVYRRNVLANQHDALAATYPVVRRLVGDAFFRESATRYALAHPSDSGDLHRFGAHLAAFLAAYAPARELSYLPDVARLEWAVARSFH